MRMKTVAQWLFVYLPVRFTVPFLGLLAWYLFYLWPWVLDLFFPSETNVIDVRDTVRNLLKAWFVPKWIDVLNLTPAAQALGVIALLVIGILVVYNVAALWYQGIRRWSSERLLIGTLLLNTFIYSYPWLFAPKDWSEYRYSLVPYYLRDHWRDGFDRYGVLWFLPALIMVGALSFELARRRNSSTPVVVDIRESGAELPPVRSESFETLLKDCPDLRIGLILSGGGAKGVYQAGAMRAIHEFLKHYDSLGKVKMIAGTSIGSWNSAFWLANLVGAETGKLSIHEQWWQTASVSRIIEFAPYFPLLKNSMLNSRPWRENFQEVFGDSSLAAVAQNHEGVHFYLTRSNVAQGRLEFSTNWSPDERERALGDDIQMDSFTEARTLEAVRDAVFASMDLPPLFPYMKIGYEYFEDGGVVDNLPIRFGILEQCDLIFVLALNASFEEKPEQHSIAQRLMRVLDVRQGVLERNSMRLAYLYNHIHHLGGGRTAAAKLDKPLRVFAICPQQPLAVGTGEFWKTNDFGLAFHTMYNATRVELTKFNFKAIPAAKTDDHSDWIRMALVSAAGEITYTYRF